MKKNYQKPIMEVVGVQMENQVLAGSPGGAAGAPGINAGRTSYGSGIDDTWD